MLIIIFIKKLVLNHLHYYSFVPLITVNFAAIKFGANSTIIATN